VFPRRNGRHSSKSFRPLPSAHLSSAFFHHRFFWCTNTRRLFIHGMMRFPGVPLDGPFAKRGLPREDCAQKIPDRRAAAAAPCRSSLTYSTWSTVFTSRAVYVTYATPKSVTGFYLFFFWSLVDIFQIVTVYVCRIGRETNKYTTRALRLLRVYQLHNVIL